jgi:hypothetical protein
MEEMKELGEQFYAESGILRAIDIHWNPAKR